MFRKYGLKLLKLKRFQLLKTNSQVPSVYILSHLQPFNQLQHIKPLIGLKATKSLESLNGKHLYTELKWNAESTICKHIETI